MDARTGWMVPLLAVGLIATAACVKARPEQGKDKQPVAVAKTMRAFANEGELQQLLATWRAQIKRERELRAAESMADGAAMPMPSPPAPPAPAQSVALMAPGTVADASESITNVQTQGVDEGDIVKKHGDYLIVLRRGRLFTIRIGDDSLRPVSTVNAYAPDANPSGTWYDEMLVGGNTVVVIGFSYARGGTEVGLFDIDANGGLHYRDTYQLRSNDYYSARNYASRLIGDKLIFYTPLRINLWGDATDAFMPALRHWHRDATPADFKRILPATRIYRTTAQLDPDDGIALHTVNICDLAAQPMRCESTAVLGPSGRVFYVSQDSVFVWAASWSHGSEASKASVFRIPLDGSAPSALQASGSPIDQMSFLQRDGYLNVLLSREGGGEGMWASLWKTGDLALLRVALDEFGDGSTFAKRDDYRLLPGTHANSYNLHNRFIGDWLLVGAGRSYGDERNQHSAQALRYATPGPVQTLRLGHAVERIDALGNDAVLVGNHDDDLHFTSVHLDATAAPASVFVQRNAAQGDDRTHGFFYKPRDEDEGIVGLPIVRGDDSAAVLYLRNRKLRLGRYGTLDASRREQADDGCQASCVDWYGNARPIFIGERVFALLGYELVEGAVRADGIGERRRVDFTPAVAVAE